MESFAEESPILRLVPVLQRLLCLTEVHKKFGITKSQIVIFIILRYKGSLSMSEIAKYLASSKEQATRAVSTLYDNGLIERFEDPGNRTHVYVRFTEAGKERMRALLAEMNQAVSDRINSSLSAEDIEKLDESIRTTTEILSKVQ